MGQQGGELVTEYLRQPGAQIAWWLTSWALESDTAWVPVLALRCISCVTLSKSLLLSVPQFLPLLMGTIKETISDDYEEPWIIGTVASTQETLSSVDHCHPWGGKGLGIG